MKNFLKISSSIVLGVLFLWLAFKDVAFSDILEATRGMSYTWVIPFIFATLAAHLVRAVRWKMLFTNKEKTPAVTTLFTGVMFGYLTNIVLPRVGEVTRPVYVARQVGESSSKLIGTIVLERIIDLLSMVLLMIFVGIFLVSDPQVLSRLFGIDFTDTDTQLNLLLTLITYAAIAILGAVVFYWIINQASKRSQKINGVFLKGKKLGRTFLDGILAIRELKNWPLFIVFTALIWFLYIFMTYVGFWMFDMHEIYSLGMTEALVLTVVSAIGLSIPTPGGLGTYHLFITKSLFILYGVPEATGLAYATIAHAGTLVIIIISSPLLLALDKYLLLKKNSSQ